MSDIWDAVTETVTPLANRPTIKSKPRDVDRQALRQTIVKNYSNSLRYLKDNVPRSRTKVSVDLHGYSVRDAHRAVIDLIEGSRGRKSVHVVTGRSGAIREEFPLWVVSLPMVREIVPVSGGGAFVVKFYKWYRQPR